MYYVLDVSRDAHFSPAWAEKVTALQTSARFAENLALPAFPVTLRVRLQHWRNQRAPAIGLLAGNLFFRDDVLTSLDSALGMMLEREPLVVDDVSGVRYYFVAIPQSEPVLDLEASGASKDERFGFWTGPERLIAARQDALGIFGISDVLPRIIVVDERVATRWQADVSDLPLVSFGDWVPPWKDPRAMKGKK
jgi:hypothetical protein